MRGVMTNFLFFILAVIGMTLIITRGDIFSEFRAWVMSFSPKVPSNQDIENGTPPVILTTSQHWRRKITMAINCCQCTGFWCGIFCGFWYVFCSSDVNTNFVIDLFKLFLCGCVGSFVSLTADVFLEYLFHHK
jgi:hypothetical protein